MAQAQIDAALKVECEGATGNAQSDAQPATTGQNGLQIASANSSARANSENTLNNAAAIDSRKNSRDLEERRKLMNSRLNEERRSKEERLREAQRIADGKQARLVEERRRQQDEKRKREEERFRIVHERRRRQEELAKARLQQLLDSFRRADARSKRRTRSTPRHATNGVHERPAPPNTGANAGRSESPEAKIPRSQSNIDRLATPRGDARSRIGHKYCLISSDDFEVFRDPFNYRRARSTSRETRSHPRERTASAKRHGKLAGCCEHCEPARFMHCVLDCRRGTPVHHCCRHCDVSNHCAKSTCGHKAPHCCCTHCVSPNHCNDASCPCERHAHKCCNHCETARRLHCATNACGHSRVHLAAIIVLSTL